MDPLILPLFPTPVVRFNNSQVGIADLISASDKINYNTRDENANTFSQTSNLLDSAPFSKLRNFFEQSLEYYKEEIMMGTGSLQITQSWINRNPRGTSVHSHIHPNSIVSGVFYLRKDGGSAAINFEKSNREQLCLKKRGNNKFNIESTSVICESGDLLLFPSSLRHSVDEHNQEEDRLSIAFNTFSAELGEEFLLNHLKVREIR